MSVDDSHNILEQRLPFLAASFAFGFLWKSIALDESSEFLNYKALSICFLVGGFISYVLLLTCHRGYDSHGHLILSSFGQFLYDSYNWFHKVEYNIAHFKFSSYLLSGPAGIKEEIYDGTTLGTILASALSIGAPATALIAMSFSASAFRPKGQLLPSNDQYPGDLISPGRHWLCFYASLQRPGEIRSPGPSAFVTPKTTMMQGS